jgi:hypothetical protein
MVSRLESVRTFVWRRAVARFAPQRAVRQERHKSYYAFVFGPVALTVRYWEEHDLDVEAGARVELRRCEPDVGRAHRDGAAGFRVQSVVKGGIWRADLFRVVSRPGGEPRFHYHPHFSRRGVGRRVFDPALTADPVGWTEHKLADLRSLLDKSGAGDIADEVDYDSFAAAMPLIRRAIEHCLEAPPKPGP